MNYFDIEAFPCANEKQLDYLAQKISTEDLQGFWSFIQAQEAVFQKYSHYLEVVIQAFVEAPVELGMKCLEEEFYEYLKQKGVSSSRITHVKGSIKLKKMVKENPLCFTPEDSEILVSLETEKAYLASRMTIEGQLCLCELFRKNNGLTLVQVRNMLKRHVYDPSKKWVASETVSGDCNQASNEELRKQIVSRNFVPRGVLQLVGNLSLIVDELLEKIELWEGDPRVLSVVDQDDLARLAGLFGCYPDPKDI
jgi:hypothetical protein